MIDVFFSLVGSSCEKLVMLFVNDQTRNQLQKQREQQKTETKKEKFVKRIFVVIVVVAAVNFIRFQAVAL